MYFFIRKTIAPLEIPPSRLLLKSHWSEWGHVATLAMCMASWVYCCLKVGVLWIRKTGIMGNHNVNTTIKKIRVIIHTLVYNLSDPFLFAHTRSIVDLFWPNVEWPSIEVKIQLKLRTKLNIITHFIMNP